MKLGFSLLFSIVIPCCPAWAIRESLGEIYFAKPKCSDYLTTTIPSEQIGWTRNHQAVYLDFAVHGDSSEIAIPVAEAHQGMPAKDLAAKIRQILKKEIAITAKLRASKELLKDLIHNKAIAWVGVEFFPGEMTDLTAFFGMTLSADLMKQSGLGKDEIENALLIYAGPILYLKFVDRLLFNNIETVYLESQKLKEAQASNLREMQKISGQYGSAKRFDELDKVAEDITRQRDLYAAEQIFKQTEPGYVDYGSKHEAGVRAALKNLHIAN